MRLYLDTNVILARYAPNEPQHEEAKKLLNRIETGTISAVTSVLTLIEVVSATSKAFERFGDKSEALGREEVAGAFLRRVLNIKKLDFIPTGGEASFNVKERSVQLPALFALALEIGSKTGLKTLDTLHLASASIASRIYESKIDYFVTLDEDMLKHHKDISSIIESKVVSPAHQF